MPAAARKPPRQRQPELEHAYARPPSLGYEAAESAGLVRCLAHGFPTPLARWHFHDEYELHLITATSGKAFVGDWIGPFQAGHLVLCGPRLPHNWVSFDLPDGGVSERDLVIQFSHAPIAHAAEQIPEAMGQWMVSLNLSPVVFMFVVIGSLLLSIMIPLLKLSSQVG